jgi:leucyl-tRNA synthetase
MNKKYQPQEFEKKWVEEWEKGKIYKSEIRSTKSENKKYVLAMFPYPSGAGLHVGHVRNYTGTDVVARYFRMNNYSVLHPIGWDAFGLPAENAAVKAKKNPMDMVPENIATFKKQMKMLGFSYDWDREFSTTDPSYYKWTQWLFIQFYKMGLLYKKNTPINFCPSCKTGLAEEEVLANGTHERCGSKIEKRDLPQWIFKITAYADRLLADLDGLDWPEGILEMQRNWIGRSEGMKFKEKVKDLDIEFEVFDTVPQTYIAQTFTVIAPEHPMVEKLVKGTKYEKGVMTFVEKIKEKKLAKKFDVEKEIEGIFTGRYVDNPFGKGDLPIWVASYAIYDYGTGIVNCSAHDERDFAFAKKYNIPLRVVMLPKDKKLAEKVKNLEVCYHHAEDGIIQEPLEFKGMTWKETLGPIIDFIEKKGLGKRGVHYHLRDWIFSRQRYWGEPIPMVFCESCSKKNNETMKQLNNKMPGWFPIPEEELPLKLPYIKSYEPTETGESPLSAIPEFVNTKCPKCGGAAKRETDTMPNWAGSCWYFIAFSFWNQEARFSFFDRLTPPKAGPFRVSPVKGKPQAIVSKKVSSPPTIENCLHSEALAKEWKLKIKNSGNWLPVDWYLGGAEHAVLHLLYARFWVKALYDLKLLNFKEPFLRLRNQGMVLAEDHRKMSKSFNNVINPDEVVKEYGADTLRIYEMFMAPFNAEISWSTKALQGSYRFVKRVWDIFQQYNNETMKQFNNENKQLIIKLQKTINKVTSDITNVKFNTSVASMMEFLNDFERNPQGLSRESAKKIWRNAFGEKTSIHLSAWPKVEDKMVDEEIIIPVQINGKLRSTVKIQSSLLRQGFGGQAKIEELAMESEKIKKYLTGKPKKIIYVPGKIINLII